MGFDSRHEFFNPPAAIGAIGRLFDVEYSSSRPAITMYDPRQSAVGWAERLIRQLLLTKSIDWSYEQERRFILPLDDQLTFPHDVDSSGRHLFTIAPAAVIAVVIGARASETTQATIRRAMTEPPMKHVSVFRARPSTTQFQLVIEPA